MTTEDRVVRVRLELAQGYQFLATFPDLPGAGTITVDEPSPLGGGEGPNAAALLAAAIGNCLAASLVFCLRRARGDAQGVTADVTAHIVRNEAGRFRIGSVDVALSPDVPEADLARLQRCEGLFENFCIVTQSVRQGIPVNVTLKPERVPESLQVETPA